MGRDGEYVVDIEVYGAVIALNVNINIIGLDDDHDVPYPHPNPNSRTREVYLIRYDTSNPHYREYRQREGFAKNGETWISKQHFLIKVNVLFFFGILVFTCFFKGYILAQEMLQCDSTVMMTSVLCLNLNKFKVALAENLAQFIDLVCYWVIFALGVFTIWINIAYS